MAKKSGSKSSRDERRAGRKRAERAREHGLPVRREAPQRVRASTPQPGSQRDGEDRSSDAPPVHSAKPPGIPTLVKVLGGALVILLGVYLLSRQRDESLNETKASPEVLAASAAPESQPAPGVSPSSSPAPAASALAPAPEVVPAEDPAPVVSVTPPAKPVVAVPVVANPAPPKAEKPLVAAAKLPAPVAVPVVPVAAPVVVPAAPAAPVPAAPSPKPLAPKPAAPVQPADNPY